MKKVILITLCALFMFTLMAACGGGGTTDNPGTADSTPAPTADNSDNRSTDGDGDNVNVPDPGPANSFDYDRVIGVHTRESGSGTRDAFVSITGVGDDMYEEAVVLGSTNEIRTAVAGSEYAIGYISVGSINDEIKTLTVDGIFPSDATILDGSYALQRPLLVCVTDEMLANEIVADFIAYMISPQGQENIGSSWTAISDPGADYEASGLTGELRVGGSTSVEPLMLRMVEGYNALNPGVDIDVSATGSGAGISGAGEGELDIGMSSRELREAELETLTPIVIALDGVAVIVNMVNPLENLTLDQIREIFVGEITRWNQIG